MSLLTKCYFFFFPPQGNKYVVSSGRWEVTDVNKWRVGQIYTDEMEKEFISQREREGERGRDGAKCSLRAQMKMRNKEKSDSYDLAQRQPHRETVFIMESVKSGVKWLCRRLEEWKRNEGTDWGFYLLRLFCHLNTTFVLSQKQRLSKGRGRCWHLKPGQDLRSFSGQLLQIQSGRPNNPSVFFFF